MNWRNVLLVSNRRRIEIFGNDEYTGKIPWKLKIGREYLPRMIDKVQQQEDSEDRSKWIEDAKHWLKNRSSGFKNRVALGKDEIKLRKKELGKLLTEYNRYYSEGDLIQF